MERDIKPTYDELESYVENLQKQLADAQATIAALQARVEAHERAYQEGHPTPCTLGSYCPYCEIERRVAQLTQRTAELEAAKAELNTVRRDAGLDCGDHSCLYAMNKTGMRTNGGCRCSPKHMKNDLGRSRKACDDMHAELERVRAALEDACLSVAVHGEQPPQKWLDALRHRQGMEG